MFPYTFYIIPSSSSITFLSSVALIASKISATTSYNEATCYGQCKHMVAMLEDIPSPFLLLGIYPANLGLDASTLVLVAAHLALVVSSGVGIATAVVWRRGKAIRLPRFRTLFVLFILFVTTSLIFSAFVTSFAFHAQSAHFDMQYRSQAGGFGYANTYDKGMFDLESWTCGVKDLKSMRYYPELGRQCVAERAGTACVAIVAVFAILMSLAMGWDVKSRGAFIEVKNRNEGENGLVEVVEVRNVESGASEGEGWRDVDTGTREKGEKIRYG